MKKILNKLSSRKLWISLGAVVGCVLTALCGEPDNATQIVAVVGAVASAISYVLGEASVDRAAVASRSDTSDTDVIGFTVDENFE
jgi:drug/metabolite transporter (DMT)-like permease